MKALVTKDSLQAMLDNPNQAYVGMVIGRALVALLERQTYEEQNTEATLEDNGVGFTGADAKTATYNAKGFIRFGKMTPKGIAVWTKRNGKGYSRLTKYWAQLNEIANEKAAKKVA